MLFTRSSPKSALAIGVTESPASSRSPGCSPPLLRPLCTAAEIIAATSPSERFFTTGLGFRPTANAPPGNRATLRTGVAATLPRSCIQKPAPIATPSAHKPAPHIQRRGPEPTRLSQLILKAGHLIAGNVTLGHRIAGNVTLGHRIAGNVTLGQVKAGQFTVGNFKVDQFTKGRRAVAGAASALVVVRSTGASTSTGVASTLHVSACSIGAAASGHSGSCRSAATTRAR